MENEDRDDVLKFSHRDALDDYYHGDVPRDEPPATVIVVIPPRLTEYVSSK